MKTDDIAFAAHLIQRGYTLEDVTREGNRSSFTFAIGDDEARTERSWFVRYGIADTYAIGRALAAGISGKPINNHVLQKWPELALASTVKEGGA